MAEVKLSDRFMETGKGLRVYDSVEEWEQAGQAEKDETERLLDLALEEEPK